jgi:hypothetical protein
MTPCNAHFAWPTRVYLSVSVKNGRAKSTNFGIMWKTCTEQSLLHLALVLNGVDYVA